VLYIFAFERLFLSPREKFLQIAKKWSINIFVEKVKM